MHTDPYLWISQWAAAEPTRICLTSDTRQLSYQTLDLEAGRYAMVLTDLGVGCGDRVAAQVDNAIEVVILYCACLRLGAVYVPINPANTSHEVAYFLNDAAPKLAVVRPAERPALLPLAEQARVLHVESLGHQGEGSLIDRVQASARLVPPPAQLPADALAALVYTSGTTGRPKGAMLTRGNLASNAAALATAWQFSADDVLLHCLPLCHVHGLFVALNTAFAAGACVRLIPQFNPEKILQLLPLATVFMGVPTHYMRLLALPRLNRDSTAAVRLFISGSAPLLPQTHQEFARRTGHFILERYGMTETLINTSNPYDGLRLPGAVGPALPGTTIRVINTDTGLPDNAPDVVGCLEIMGPNVCAGYWRSSDKTAAEFSVDGWFNSGDVGRIDASGYVHIVGRVKDLIITGGYNVYPKEVESEIDALAGVVESAVIGVPHADLGEAVIAVVVLSKERTLTEESVLANIRVRLAKYKTPKRVLLVSELPRNTMGKVQKNILRERYKGLYTV